MLSHLQIKNIALIDQVTIEFDEGLNIITGETGTGKSIVIDSMNLLLGERADRNLIRVGEETAYVEGIFNLEDIEEVSPILDSYGIVADDGVLIVARELSATGKNICRINGRAVTLSALKKVTKHLIDIHGQHEHQSLLSIESHKIFLDSFGGKYIENTKRQVSDCYRELKKIQRKIDKIGGSDRNGRVRRDYIKYQLNEIIEANLMEDEDEELIHERAKLQNAEQIMEGIVNAYNLLYSGWSSMPSIYDGLGNICSELSNLSTLDKSLVELSDRFNNIYYELGDSIEQLRNYKDSFYFDENRLDEIERRLNVINDLKRKYGTTIEEIIKYGQELEEELEQIENNSQILNELKEKEELMLKQLYSMCENLSTKRRKVADEFESQLLQQLSDLGMDQTKFSVEIKSDKNNISSDGFDEIEFLISPNPGEPLKPLAKIVSGGEMARIMLAFKTILADVDNIPTLIFDEIDVGISGRIAQIVAQKMAIISSSHQLICVTHLPQIAAMADRHFSIEKYTDEKRTYTTARVLHEGERQMELAKMLGDARLSKLSLDHALELISNSNAYKAKL